MASEKGKSSKKVQTVVVADPGRIQPQAVEVERAVLGALMLEKDAYSEISDMLRADCFYDKKHELIFAAIVELAIAQRPIDMLTVTDQLKKDGNLKAAGGVIYISQLTNNLASTAHLEYHAKIIAQKHIARELIRYSGKIQGEAFDETIDIKDLMEEAEGMLFEITQQNIKKEAIQIDPIIKSAVNNIFLARNKKEGLSGVPSGFTDLDKITSGWQKSDLIIIAARPAMGKTAFVLSMAKNMAVDFEIPVAVFSLEMSNIQLVNRLISNVCELPGDKIKSGRLEDYELKQLESKVASLYNASIYVDDTPSLSVFELRSKARRLVREHKVQCIFIDYLQLMNASGMAYGNREQEVSMISRSLKGLAKELDIPIIALSQLNRGVEKRADAEGKRPQLSDLRESGAIEQDADMVCFIHRPEYYGIKEDSQGNSLLGLAEIIVAKHRNGSVGSLWLTFKSAFVRFENNGSQNTSYEFSSKINEPQKFPDSQREALPPVSNNNDDFITQAAQIDNSMPPF